jgi:hypothetical protein
MARISTGKNSKQDYKTPKEFVKAVEKRFGPITLDLAARDYNKVCDRYLAPCTGPEGPLPYDDNAYGIDSFDYNWADIYGRLGGLFYLNCEFGSIDKWAARCLAESAKGAVITLLIPYGTTKAFRKQVLKHADLYLLEGRLQFIPGESFPKDCLIAHYYPGSGGHLCFWDWKTDEITARYEIDTSPHFDKVSTGDKQ